MNNNTGDSDVYVCTIKFIFPHFIREHFMILFYGILTCHKICHYIISVMVSQLYKIREEITPDETKTPYEGATVVSYFH